MEMETKQISEITKTFTRGSLKGLATHLFFSGGLKHDRRKFFEIDVSSNNIKVGDETLYETMAFGRGKSIYCERVNTREEMTSAHFKAVNHFKEEYLKQIKA